MVIIGGNRRVDLHASVVGIKSVTWYTSKGSVFFTHQVGTNRDEPSQCNSFDCCNYCDSVVANFQDKKGNRVG